MSSSPHRSSPLLDLCMLLWGHHDTSAQPMLRYIAQALNSEPPAIRRSLGRANSSHAIPSPQARASKKLRPTNSPSCPEVGSGPSEGEGQIICPRTTVGSPRTTVTSRTLCHVLILLPLSPDRNNRGSRTGRWGPSARSHPRAGSLGARTGAAHPPYGVSFGPLRQLPRSPSARSYQEPSPKKAPSTRWVRVFDRPLAYAVPGVVPGGAVIPGTSPAAGSILRAAAGR